MLTQKLNNNPLFKETCDLMNLLGPIQDGEPQRCKHIAYVMTYASEKKKKLRKYRNLCHTEETTVNMDEREFEPKSRAGYLMLTVIGNWLFATECYGKTRVYNLSHGFYESSPPVKVFDTSRLCITHLTTNTELEPWKETTRIAAAWYRYFSDSTSGTICKSSWYVWDFKSCELLYKCPDIWRYGILRIHLTSNYLLMTNYYHPLPNTWTIKVFNSGFKEIQTIKPKKGCWLSCCNCIIDSNRIFLRHDSTRITYLKFNGEDFVDSQKFLELPDYHTCMPKVYGKLALLDHHNQRYTLMDIRDFENPKQLICLDRRGFTIDSFGPDLEMRFDPDPNIPFLNGDGLLFTQPSRFVPFTFEDILCPRDNIEAEYRKSLKATVTGDNQWIPLVQHASPSYVVLRSSKRRTKLKNDGSLVFIFKNVIVKAINLNTLGFKTSQNWRAKRIGEWA